MEQVQVRNSSFSDKFYYSVIVRTCFQKDNYDSLIRFFLLCSYSDLYNYNLDQYIEELGMTLGEALLTPTIIYVKPVLAAIEAAEVHGVSHITGGGFYENIPRMLKEGMGVEINVKSFPRPAIFDFIKEIGNKE